MRRTTVAISAPVLTLVFTSAAVSGRQLASRPAPDWIQRLERPERIATLKIDYIISKLELKPGQVVADLGAGPGVISLPMAKTVGPTGKVYAVDIDQAFIDHITMRAKEQGIGNVTAVLGKFTDPGLPARDVDGCIARSVVDHDDFEWAQRLRLDARDGCRQRARGVVGGDDDRNGLAERNGTHGSW